MAITLLTSTVDADNGGANSTTTPAIDTSGASLLVVGTSVWIGGGNNTDPAFSDSASNTWTRLTWVPGADTWATQLAYAASPSTSGSHTFTVANSNQYPGVVVAVLAGTSASPFDQEVDVSDEVTVSAIQNGSLTPGEDGMVFLTVAASDNPHTGPSLNQSFTVAQFKQKNNSLGVALGYFIQSAAALKNPTWTFTGSGVLDTKMATFKAAAGGGRTTRNTHTWPLGMHLGMHHWHNG